MEEDLIKKKDEKMSEEEYQKLKRASERRKAAIVVLLFIVALLIITVGIYFINGDTKYNNKENTPTPTPPSTVPTSPTPYVNTTSDFTYQEENYGLSSYGYAIVKGYVVETNNQIGFYVANTESKDFKRAMETWGYDDNIVPLGCKKDNIISYISGADEFGPSSYTGSYEDAWSYYTKEISLSNDVTNKIMSSSNNNQISLKLGKAKLTRFINLYDECKTVITSVDLVN